jgi:hypothetical protein
MDSKLADESRKALIAEAKRLTREERLQAFVRHSKLVTELHNSAKNARPNESGCASQ